MAITSYTELKASIANYLARSDLTTVIPDFITQAESRLNRTLRTWEMETSASVTMSSGIGTLPADYLEWLAATWTSTDARSQDLRYMEPNSEEWRLRFRPNTDPQMFSILASNIRIKPVQTGNITFSYYGKLASLTSTNSTNWLLTKAPDIYVSYSLAEAYSYLKDEARTDKYMAQGDAQTASIVSQSDTNKVARRPNRLADTTEIQAARNEQTSGI